MKFYYLLFCLFPFFSFSQTMDDFSDGNFTKNPSWIGDTATFEVNISKQLHLCGAGSDTSILFTRINPSAKMEWNFWLKLSFNTSANNHARIYFATDTTDIQHSNGYYLQVGGTDDSLFIIRQLGGAIEKLYRVKTYKTLHTTNSLRFKITQEFGIWEVMIDTVGGYNFSLDGMFKENSLSGLCWFGIFCRYTSSNATKFYFDDFYAGPVIYDTTPPVLSSVEFINQKQIKLTFSEGLQRGSAEDIAHYPCGAHHIIPDSARMGLQYPTEVILYYSDLFIEAHFDTLFLHGIMDLAGNFLSDSAVVVSYYRVKARDILIHEILADPEPSAGLPEGEFVELYNQTIFPVNLKDWSIIFGGSIRVFPSVVIQPRGFLLIVKDTSFSRFASCVTMFTSSSSLSNEGTTLILKDSQQRVIHTVTYSRDWYRGSFKENGGWSLEMIDESNPCGCAENWDASRGTDGGTPGNINSIQGLNTDLSAPFAVKANILNPHLVQVYFSETIDTTVLFPGHFKIEPGSIIPENIIGIAPQYRSFKLYVKEPFQKGLTYTLSSSKAIRDCVGNHLDSNKIIRFAIPDSIQKSDIVINEVLSHPEPDGSRFIELFNRSAKVIDLQELVISNLDTLQGLLPGAKQLLQEGHLLFPGDYLVLTNNPNDISDRYYTPFPAFLVTMEGFPVFGEDSGNVILARKDNLLIIDKMHYNERMHYPLLVTQEGVSLERFNADQPSMAPDNWHSAAETAGFATPGYQNSHRLEFLQDPGEITLVPDVFSPDNDGKDDYLNIVFNIPETDCAATIVIYDSHGRLVLELVNNILLANHQTFTWDGMTHDRIKAPIGYYVLFIEIIKPNGIVIHKKLTTVLGGHF
ncbi:MAG: lamin tail domain-containing protein [Bacteroidales bacterium]|nr:lamin tail domain-containing protein [Bacteroidales bacterium]